MSLYSDPLVISPRIDFGDKAEHLTTIHDEYRVFDVAKIAILNKIISQNSLRRQDEFKIRDWKLGFGAPVNTRELKKGDIVVKNKINNKLQHNYIKRLSRIRTGYLGGRPVRYTLKPDYYSSQEKYDKATQLLLDFLSDSNVSDIDSETIHDLTVYGQCGRLMYVGVTPFVNEPTLVARHVAGYDCLFIASKEWWKPELSVLFLDGGVDNYDVYDRLYVHRVRGGSVVSSEDHFMGWNPLIPYYNNRDKIGNLDDCHSKINDVDEQRSNISSLLTTQRLLMKIFKDVDVDPETVEKTQQMGYIKIKTNSEGKGDVYFETININAGAAETHIDKVEKAIYLDSGIVNLEDKTFGNESGEAKKYYLISMESNCLDTENKCRVSNNVMIGILARYLSTITDFHARSVEQTWERNLPSATKEDVDNFVQLWNKVPISEAYKSLHFVKDPDELARQYKEENNFEFEETP